MVNTEIFSGNVYGKGEVAREEAEARQQKREEKLRAREYKQMRERRKKEARATLREVKRQEAEAMEIARNAPKTYYAVANIQEYRQILTRHFETCPDYISFQKDGQPMTDDMLKDVLV